MLGKREEMRGFITCVHFSTHIHFKDLKAYSKNVFMISVISKKKITRYLFGVCVCRSANTV